MNSYVEQVETKVDKSANGWTEPYYGVQHYGSAGANSFWATVQDYGSFAISLVWTPGCQFSPMEEQHDTPEAARKHAENSLHTLTNGRIGVAPARVGGGK